MEWKFIFFVTECGKRVISFLILQGFVMKRLLATGLLNSVGTKRLWTFKGGLRTFCIMLSPQVKEWIVEV